MCFVFIVVLHLHPDEIVGLRGTLNLPPLVVDNKW